MAKTPIETQKGRPDLGGEPPGPSAAAGDDAPKPTYLTRLRSRVELPIAIPLYAFLAVVLILPAVFLLRAAFQTGAPTAPDTQYTGANFIALFSEPRHLQVLWSTIRLSVFVTMFAATVGSLLAWLVARTDLPMRRAFEALIPIPLFLSPFALGIAWVILGSPASGLLNILYRAITGSEEPLFTIFSFTGLVWTMGLFFVPYSYLFTVSSLSNMDGTLEEASQIAGSTTWQTMRRVTFPLMIPAVTSALLIVFVLSSEMFSIPGLIGVTAGYRTLPYLIYQYTHLVPPNWPVAAAAGVALFLMMSVGVILQRRVSVKDQRYVTVTGKGVRPTIIRLGGWRYVSAAFVCCYLMMALILPFGALFMATFISFFSSTLSPELFTLRWWPEVLRYGEFQDAVRNTLTIAVIGPTLAILIGFFLTFLWRRTRAPLGREMEILSTAPVAVPGLVVSMAFLWTFIRTPLYGTVGLLVLAYVARLLYHPIRMFSSSMVQLDRGLDEASRVAGAGILRTMRSVSLPLLKTTGLSVWLLLFILMVRELNTAIMLTSGQVTVLPVLMWGHMEHGVLQGASVMALMEMALILITYVIARAVLGLNLSHRTT